MMRLECFDLDDTTLWYNDFMNQYSDSSTYGS